MSLAQGQTLQTNMAFLALYGLCKVRMALQQNVQSLSFFPTEDSKKKDTGRSSGKEPSSFSKLKSMYHPEKLSAIYQENVIP